MSDLVLREYQDRALMNMRERVARDKRVLLYSPTGSGKTEMAMALVQRATKKKKRVAFVVNRVQLGMQASRRFAKSGISHGVIQGENTARVYMDVLICSIQTIAKRGLPDVDLIIIDEAHAVAGSKDYRALIATKDALIVGLTATPFARGLGMHDDRIGGALFESITVECWALARDLVTSICCCIKCGQDGNRLTPAEIHDLAVALAMAQRIGHIAFSANAVTQHDQLSTESEPALSDSATKH